MSSVVEKPSLVPLAQSDRIALRTTSVRRRTAQRSGPTRRRYVRRGFGTCEISSGVGDGAAASAGSPQRCGPGAGGCAITRCATSASSGQLSLEIEVAEQGLSASSSADAAQHAGCSSSMRTDIACISRTAQSRTAVRTIDGAGYHTPGRLSPLHKGPAQAGWCGALTCARRPPPGSRVGGPIPSAVRRRRTAALPPT